MYTRFANTAIAGWNIFSPIRSTMTTQAIFPATRFFSRSFSAWAKETSAQPYRLADFFTNDKFSLPKNVHISAVNPNYVTRSPGELKTIFNMIGSLRGEAPYRDSIQIPVFTPARSALHAVGSIVATEIKCENDEHYLSICKRLNNIIQPQILDFLPTYSRVTKDIHNTVQTAVMNCMGKTESDDPLEQKIINIRNAIIAKNKNHFSYLNLISVVTKIVIDDMIRDFTTHTTHELAAETISNEVKKHHLTELETMTENNRHQFLLLLPQFSADKRLMKFIAGGAASGKSSLAKQFAQQIKHEYGLSLADFAYLNIDRFRLLFLNDPSLGENNAIHGTLTQDECWMLLSKSNQLIEEKLQNTGQAPNIFRESFSPTPDEIKFATRNGGKLRVSVTSYPPEKAVEGNYNRFLDKRERMLPIDIVLSGQKKVVSAIPQILNEHSGKDILLYIYNTYSIIHENNCQHGALLGVVDCQYSRIYIRDIAGMLEFIKKLEINHSAVCPNTIFPEPEKVSLSANIDRFLEHFGSKEIVFINPEAKDFDFNLLGENTYAIYNFADELNIENHQLFEDVIAEDEKANELFAALKPQPTTPTLSR